MEGKGLAVSDDEADTQRMSMESRHSADSSSRSAIPSRSRSIESAVPETAPTAVPPLLRRTPRMRTGPYCPMPSFPRHQTEAGSSRVPAHYTLSPADPYARPPTATERYSRYLSDLAREPGEGTSRDIPKAPGGRGLTPDEIQSLRCMSSDLRGVVLQSIEHDSRIRELYVDLRHAESMAIRAMRMTRRWMWMCCLLMFLLMIVIVRLF